MMQHFWLAQVTVEPKVKYWLFTIYKKFPENLVGKQIEHDFFGRSSRKFREATEDLKR